MNGVQTIYHCEEFDADIFGTRWAEILSEEGYTVTARTEVQA
jgi:hypothetical protein